MSEVDNASCDLTGGAGQDAPYCDDQARAAPAADTDDPTPETSNTPINMDERVVKHVMVIGFHHKHGYQVEYCYPPIEPGGPIVSERDRPINLPNCWKSLPLLSLPDGSHNHNSDVTYFTIPDNVSQPTTDATDANKSSGSGNESTAGPEGIKTIFGTACYRQIQADKLVNRTEDITRFAVQKSVCVLSTKPLFGLIRSKLEMITHAYFDELDFSKVKILELTYENLNSLLRRESIKENGIFLGLSARQLVSQFGCNVLVLFKAMLLEKRILFYKSPARDLCTTVMSMCSLFTGLLESGGLDYCSCDLQLSEEMLELLKLSSEVGADQTVDESKDSPRDCVFFSPSKEEVVILKDMNSVVTMSSLGENQEVEIAREQLSDADSSAAEQRPNQEDADEDEEESEIIYGDELVVDDDHALKLCRMKPEECGMPLQIFMRGSLCFPYLSITYLDLLSDKRIKSFVVGATNILFKHQRDLYDIIVDMEENNISIKDSGLRKCLSLTTEDLRFMDYIGKHIKMEDSARRDEFDLISHDISRWLGGDEWIRFNFRLYSLYLLKASRLVNNQHNSQLEQQVIESFNETFLCAWKQSTSNYRIWETQNKHHLLNALQLRHPFSNQSAKSFNFSDMKLRLSYAVNSSEKGRMLNQTLNGIGKWSIWNNIASAASAASSSTSSIQQLAANIPSTIKHNVASRLVDSSASNTAKTRAPQQQQQQHQESQQAGTDEKANPSTTPNQQ